MSATTRGARAIAISGVAVVTMYAALAAVQILILNPLAAVPGRTLVGIETEMASRGEDINEVAVLAILGIGVALAVLVAVVSIGMRWRARSAVSAFLALLVLGTPAYFLASFGPGMALADAFAISGADASPWAVPLYAMSLLAAAGLLASLLAEVIGATRRVTALAVKNLPDSNP